jgi:hypothetical protein
MSINIINVLIWTFSLCSISYSQWPTIPIYTENGVVIGTRTTVQNKTIDVFKVKSETVFIRLPD